MTAHSWRFFRSGGVDQVKLETSDDLRNLPSLDLKLWVALACPTSGLEIDTKMLALIDSDGDGRIRVPEILAAIAHVCKVLREPADILGRAAALPLAALREDDAEGKALASAIRAILSDLGKGGAKEISVADIEKQLAEFNSRPLNGDGVITDANSEDPAVDALVAEIVASMGGVADRSGKIGANAEKIEAFWAAGEAFLAWSRRAESEAATLMPLGAEGTPAAAAALDAVRAKADDFFARVRIAEFDARSLASLNWSDAEIAALGARVLSDGCTEAESLPIAHVAAGANLPLAGGVNPAWTARINAFRDKVVVPMIGKRDTLNAADWAVIKGALAPYLAWQADQKGKEVAGLGAARVAAILAGDLKATLLGLVAQDEALRPVADAMGGVERIVRYYASLGQLLRNFISFADFYGRTEKAIFQAGRVYFHRRSCDLVVPVQNAGRHASMAGLSSACLVYLDCTRKVDGRQLSVCAAVTDGDGDDLMVGSNGLYYDRQGRDHDAVISKIVSNPISLREAFWSPYVKFLRAIEDLINKRAAAAEAESQAKVGSAAEVVASADKTEPPKEPKKEPSKFDVGVVAAIGVAVGGITAALGALLQAFFGLGIWMPLGLLGIVLLISGPSVFIAALKLRRRNIGPILDADGWAVNAQARINIPFGRSLTALAELPPGSSRDLRDPYQQKSGRAFFVTVFLLVAAVAFLVLANKGIIQVKGLTPEPPPPPPPPAAAAPAEAPPAP